MLPVAVDVVVVVEYNDDNECLCVFLLWWCCWCECCWWWWCLEFSPEISKLLNNADDGRWWPVVVVWLTAEAAELVALIILAEFEYWLFNARNSSTNLLIWLLTFFVSSIDATRI